MSALHRRVSRRSVLSTALVLLGAAAAACGPAAAPTSTPAPAAPPTNTPAAAKPAAEPTKPAAAAPSPTAATAAKPTAAPAAAAPTKPAAAPTLSYTTISLYASWPTFDTTLMAKEWQNATGVKIDWRFIPSTQISDKLTVMLSTGDLTDMYPLSPPNMRQLGPQTSLALDDLIPQHAPNYARVLKEHEAEVPLVRAPNGKIYAMYGRNEYIYTGWLYRRDLAEKLGFKQVGGPDATVEDWYNFLKAAKKEDPKRLGLGNSGNFPNVLAFAATLRGAYGIQSQLGFYDWTTQRDGKLMDGSILPEAKDVVATVRRFYADGVVDPEMITKVEEEAGKEKWLQGRTIATPIEYFNRLDIFAGKIDVAAAVPPKGPTGARAGILPPSGWSGWPGGVAFNTKIKDPPAGLRFVDYMFSDEGVKLYYLGKEGETYQKAGESFELLPKVKEQIARSLAEKKEGLDRPDRVLQHFWGLDGHSYPEKVRPAPANIWNAYVGVVETKAVVDAQNMAKPYLAGKIPQPLYTDAEEAELTRLNADIKTYRDEMFTGMIGGKVGMDQWDAYVNQMKKLGVPRVEEIQNTAYQRTYKR